MIKNKSKKILFTFMTFSVVFSNQNILPDKFVYLDKFYTMKCVFLHKFNKWMPLSITYESVTKKSNIMTKKYN